MKKLIFKIEVFIFWFFNSRLYTTSSVWSKQLSKLLDAGEKLVLLDAYHAQFGPYKLWVANAPYASFQIDAKEGGVWFTFLPDKETGYRLYKLLKKAEAERLKSAANSLNTSR